MAETLGIPQSAAPAIGDSMNDEAMIRWAGIGVAMANGDDRIKDIVVVVTERSNDDGVAELIERCILGKGTLPFNA